MKQLVLSLFPGIDLLGLAFKREGFCVVQGGDVIFGGDIREEHYPAGKFDGVIGGPPCQAFSRLAHMVRHNGYEPKFGNLIPEFERVVAEAQPTWFVMENVSDAPTPAVDGYGVHSFMLNNRQLGQEQNRVRRWSFGIAGSRTVLMVDTCALECSGFEPAAVGSERAVPVACGPGGVRKRTALKNEPTVTASEISKGMPTGTRVKYSGRNGYTARTFARICELQGLPADFDIPSFTAAGRCKAVGNGVPLPMGRAIARAVKEATTSTLQ